MALRLKKKMSNLDGLKYERSEVGLGIRKYWFRVEHSKLCAHTCLISPLSFIYGLLR